MNNLSRHIACKICRDRKVRCDGGQPSCDKCRRSGETCIYVPTNKPTKADLTQTIEDLQERLNKAESYILRHSNTNVPVATVPLPSTTLNSMLGVDYSDSSCFDISRPATAPVLTGHPFLPVTVHSLPSIPYSHQSPISPQNMDREFINYAASPHKTVSTDPAHFLNPMEGQRPADDMSGVSTLPPARRDSVYSDGRVPIHHQVRITNEPSTSMMPPSTSSSPPPPRRGQRAEDANHILAEFTTFGMAVFNTQAEIAGISSVVAEYLNWMRKSLEMNEQRQEQRQGQGLGEGQDLEHGQGQGQGQGQEKLPRPNAAILESLEMRMREINALARTRHLDIWRQSVPRLNRIPGVGAMLNLFDNEMMRRSGETAKFFQSDYDICSPLAEQMLQKN